MIRHFRFNFPVLFLIFSAVVLILRRPDAFTNAQFFAEDGHYWYAQAYHSGVLRSLFIPAASYLQTFSRIVASISLVFPMRLAPLLFNFFALGAQLLPIGYLFSGRFKKYSFIGRFFLCISYLLLTNTVDTFLNTTNAQWYLAFSMYLILIAQPAKSWLGKVMDVLVLLIAGLSGPFSLLLLFPAFYLVLRKQVSLASLPVQVISFTASLQALTLLLYGSSSEGRLASKVLLPLEMVYKIYYRQILWGVLAGPHGYEWLLTKLPNSEMFFLVTTVLSLILVGYFLLRANPKLQILALFGGIIFASCLLSPTVYGDGQRSVYEVMLAANGIRYWLIPMVALLVVFLWSVGEKRLFIIRGVGVFFLAVLVFFQLKHLRTLNIMRYPAYIDYHWSEEVSEFRSLPSGQSKMFLINPPGWQMTLHKK